MKKMLFGKLFIMVAGLILAFGLGPMAASVAEASKPAATQPVKAHKARKMIHSKKIMAVQEALNKAGFRLKVDGMMGKHTRAAIRKFQKEHMLKVTGRVDRETRAKLGMTKTKMKQ